MNVLAPAEHRTILCVDVERFGDPDRTDRDRGAVRQGLYGALRHVFSASRIPWDDCYHEDRGDGALVLIPPHIPKGLLVTDFPQALAAALQAHNQACGPRSRIRLRAALHAGEVRRDDYGVVGSSVNQAFRLLEAAALKSALRCSRGVLAVIVSDWFFEEVIRNDPEPHHSETYQRVSVTIKETSTHAWLCLPDQPGSSPVFQVPAPRESPESVAHVPRQLPPAVDNFVGRDHELATLTKLIESRGEHNAAMVVAAIIGAPGVGKTALAVHWGHQVRDRFPDGDLYINLRGHAPGPVIQPDQALDRMLRKLGVPAEKIPAGLEAKVDRYRTSLAGRRLLLVLDNAASDGQVRPLLPGTSGCVVVVTSRNRLSGLIARDGAHTINLDRLTEGEAVDLLSQVIGAEQVDAEQRAVAEIARWCAYLPLALRVAAERMAPHSTLADVAVGLAGVRNRLSYLDTGEESSTVRTVFSWSYCALPFDAARAFRLLGLHRGPDICTDAAAALIGTTGVEARRLLEMLASKHLLEQTGRNRFRLHDLLRCYAEEQARETDTEQACASAVRRVLVWYLHTAGNAGHFPRDDLSVLLRVADDVGEPLAFATYVEAQQWFEIEHLNLMAAVQEAADTGHHDIAWRLAVALGAFAFLSKYWSDLETALRIGLAGARFLGDRVGEGHILNNLGIVCRDRDPGESIAYFHQARAVFVETRDLVGEGWAVYGLGHVLRGLRRLEESVGYLRQALGIFRESNSKMGECLALIDLGYASGGLRDFVAANDYFGKALGIIGPNRRLEGWIRHGLGYGCRGLGGFEAAAGHYEQALRIFREVGDLWGQGEALLNLSKVHEELGHPDAVRGYLTEAEVTFKDLRVPREP